MRCVWQRNFHTAVRNEKKHLLAETIYQDSKQKMVARLVVDIRTFRISKATLERFGPEGKDNTNLPRLNGLEAYLGAGRKLREALKEVSDPMAAYLFAETVRGVIQAETFLYKERGFSSVAEYGRHWEKIYLNACRYYSNLERVTRRWEEYADQESRGGYLFLRSKTYLLYQESADTYLVLGSLNDTFHEMNVWLRSAGARLTCDGEVLSVPDDVCREATIFLQSLNGVNLFAALPKKSLVEILGSGQGCTHLQDLVSDSLETLQGYLSLTDKLAEEMPMPSPSGVSRSLNNTALTLCPHLNSLPEGCSKETLGTGDETLKHSGQCSLPQMQRSHVFAATNCLSR